ncbi:MAG: HAD-IA family hydrolase [Nitrospirae bacterium]|nr:HAD-IA family hydrolase [Nitrospirota bacterium]
MIKLIIFDLDGTLVDSSVDLTNALNYAIEPYDIDRLTVQKTIGLVGEGITRLIEKLLGPGRENIRQEVMDRFMDYYSAHLVDFTRPYAGVPETLALLRPYRKAVISNKRESLSKKVLQELGLLESFDAVLGSDSVGEKKPSPRPLLKVMEMFSCGAAETVIVGDSNFDIEAGKAAGIRTIAVSYGFREVGLLQQADRIIAHIQELPPVLETVGR